MSNNVILRHRNNYKSLNLDDLTHNQINDVITYITMQVNKIYHRLYHSHPLPSVAMSKLWQRLIKLHGMLESVNNLIACKNHQT